MYNFYDCYVRQLFIIAALFIGAVVLTEVTGDLVIGSVELTEELVTSLQPWTIDMIVCVGGCLDGVVECIQNCESADGHIDNDCVETKCDDGLVTCREFCAGLFNNGTLDR